MERNPREVRFRVFHKNRMRFRSDESSTNYAGRRRAERFGFAIAQPWFDRRRTKIGGVSSLLRRTVVWQDIFFQIEVFCWRGVFDSWEDEEKTHAKPQRLGGSVNRKKRGSQRRAGLSRRGPGAAGEAEAALHSALWLQQWSQTSPHLPL